MDDIRATQRRRVLAPRELVWAQLGLTDGFFATFPVTDVRRDGERATFTVRLGVGRLAFQRAGSSSVAEAAPPERMVIGADIEDGSLRLRGTLTLSEADTDETQLSYEAELEMTYRMPRMRRLFASMVDDHVRDFVASVADAAEKQFAAERALGT